MEEINMATYGTTDLFGMSEEERSAEFDGNFEPFARERANTWHAGNLYQSEERQITSEENSESATADQGNVDELESLKSEDLEELPSALPRKSVTRRNAWGQLSYSDLIVRAIESSPDQRATLAMIYDWMIKNIPYFHDKGDSNSSAGWKNSIRHNLSLQPRFMRMPNEGTGKSSWWVINHDANSKLLRIPPRRRASTLDTKLYEKRRVRLKRKSDVTTTPACSLNSLGDGSAGEDMVDSLNAVTARLDYRCRTSSNASSIGRLSPISASTEEDSVRGISRVLRATANDVVSSLWDKVNMDCGSDENGVSEELRLLHSLSVYDNGSKSQPNTWDSITAMSVMPAALVRKVVEFDASVAEIAQDSSNGFTPSMVQQLERNVIPTHDAKASAEAAASCQRGINRLRSFLNDPATQTILAAKPELLARVREMILDKRRQMLSLTSSQLTTSLPHSHNSMTQQHIMAGGGLASDDATGFGNVFSAQYISEMEASVADSEIHQAIEQALSLADFSLDQLPYELIGSDDLLA